MTSIAGVKVVRVTRLAVAATVVAAVASQTSSVPHSTDPRPAADPRPALAAWSAPVPSPFAPDDLRPGSLRPRPVTTTAVVKAAPAVKKKPAAKPARAKRPQDLPAAGTSQYELALAYRNAVAKAPKGCNITVFHLAAIGQVESGSIGGREVTRDKVVTPAIYGPLLDGGPFAVVHDTDGGSVDGDGSFDRAVGPLQFIPGTWSWAGADGDGDGRRDPQNVYDAALGTANYLCHGGRDLARAADLRAAILSYNGSSDYLDAVLGWVDYFTQNGLKSLDDVAFKVASGGRGSDLAEPVKPPKPPAAGPDSKATAKPGTATPTTTPTSRPTTPPTGSTTKPTTTPTGPAPTTTTEPAPTPTTTSTPPPSTTTSDPPPQHGAGPHLDLCRGSRDRPHVRPVIPVASGARRRARGIPAGIGWLKEEEEHDVTEDGTQLHRVTVLLV